MIKKTKIMVNKKKPIRVLVVGCGNMGASHATAYHDLEEFEICGLVSTGKSKEVLNNKLGASYPLFNDFKEALKMTDPDAVCISTYPDTHEEFAIEAMNHGCHVFIEKPLADTVEGAQRVVEVALRTGKKVVVGYILRHHPSWIRFVELSQGLGNALVMCMDLNKLSECRTCELHSNLMKSLSPLLDCGLHLIEVMCQKTLSKPVQVSAIRATMTEEISKG